MNFTINFGLNHSLHVPSPCDDPSLYQKEFLWVGRNALWSWGPYISFLIMMFVPELTQVVISPFWNFFFEISSKRRSSCTITLPELLFINAHCTFAWLNCKSQWSSQINKRQTSISIPHHKLKISITSNNHTHSKDAMGDNNDNNNNDNAIESNETLTEEDLKQMILLEHSKFEDAKHTITLLVERVCKGKKKMESACECVV
jgi:hypothetical protein